MWVKKTAFVRLVIFFITCSVSIPSVFGLISTNIGLKPHWITEAISDTQVRGGTIISPKPYLCRSAKILKRLAEEPELTKTLYLIPSHLDHRFSNFRTNFAWVRIGSSRSLRNFTTEFKSSFEILFCMSGQSSFFIKMVL